MSTFWALCRDDAGFFLDFDDGRLQRLDSNGTLLSAAWALGMPGPKDEASARLVIANKERFEGEALDFLAVRIGTRGPQPPR